MLTLPVDEATGHALSIQVLVVVSPFSTVYGLLLPFPFPSVLYKPTKQHIQAGACPFQKQPYAL